MAFTQVPITGTVTLSNSTPAQGAYVTFTLNTPITDGTSLIAPQPIAARCNSSGAFSVTLNANDDPTTTPVGTYYSVVITYGTQTLDSFNVIVPNADSAGVDLFALAQLPNPNVTTPFVRSFGGRNGAVTLQASDIAPLGLALVPPSGDTSGATDLAALNAALAATQRVMADPGSTYYINGPIQVQTNSVLDMTAATINNVTTANYMLQNAAAVNYTNTGTDGATTSGSAVFTSATLAAVAVVGDTIQVQGGGVSGGTWYGVVQAVGGSTVTLNFKARTTVASGATWFRWTTRDHDVTIIGGYWLTPGTWPSTAGAVTHLRRIDRLTIRDCTFAGVSGASSSTHLTLHLGDLNQFRIDNVHFDNVRSDGLHIMGPASNGLITNITGTTTDDHIAIATNDGFHPTSYDCMGNITNVAIDGSYPNGSLKGLSLYDDDASHDLAFTGVSVRNVMGLTSSYGVRIGGSSTMTGISVENVAVSFNAVPPGGMVDLENFSLVDLTLENISWVDTAHSATNGIVNFGEPGQNAYMRNIRMMTNPGGTNIAVNFGGTFGGDFDFLIDGVMQEASSPSNLIPLQFHGGTANLVVLRNCNLRAGGPVVAWSGAATIKNLHIEHVVAACTTFMTVPASQTAGFYNFSDVQFTGTNFITTSSPITVKAVNLDVNTSGGVFNYTGSGATPGVMTLTNYTQAGAGTDTTKDGAQVLTLNKANYTTTTP